MPCIIEYLKQNRCLINKSSILLNFPLKCLLTSRIFHSKLSSTFSLKMIYPKQKWYSIASLLKDFKDYCHLNYNPQISSASLKVLHGRCHFLWTQSQTSQGSLLVQCYFPPRASVLSLYRGSWSQIGLQLQIRSLILCDYCLPWPWSSTAPVDAVCNFPPSDFLYTSHGLTRAPITSFCRCCIPQEKRLCFIYHFVNPEI